MIDIYTNILPNLNSGPKNVEEFLEIANVLVKQGVTEVVAAPLYDGKVSSYKEEVDLANDWLRKSSISLSVLPGQKVVASNQMIVSSEEYYMMTINENEKYMFLQIPQDVEIEVLESIAYELQLKGIVPVLNEPERHSLFVENPAHLYKLVKNGAVVQLSAQSVLGGNGSKAKKAAYQFIDHGLAHVIASGVNRENYQQYGLQKAYSAVSKKYGNSKLYHFMENAEAIASGKAVYKQEPERIKKTKFLGIF
ncbi:CpsB/CapC family capsule biosynthesis tyrosine phosphatase [Priestia megaterium]|uniref:CpsB/CapC family capsule biosynthesis tyrosine phosphatase n=1 Tax=Priestia megaterium TaxID=1404 RepID=UPI002730D3A0|nr:CpsB/CapC family capsule biosynthesis tyrosine phosphatase [Priestia megaterium]MDP1382017.1 CpsB/CapC family capsule biosynthesis tyrosine phosphatase [Priestia megaterium]MDP1422745.1 CpsB/CapC family capsule biosynthesis tyrosine phosphatase [Priestia megaterium]